jgi:hypothetical protein
MKLPEHYSQIAMLGYDSLLSGMTAGKEVVDMNWSSCAYLVYIAIVSPN